ncbi:MAG: family 20 glycosylhydrolase, partial [Steroidobacteraceae bacterium]
DAVWGYPTPLPEAARIAAYFAGLLRASHALELTVRARRGAQLPESAIAFRLEAASPGASPESYQIDVSPRQVAVTARESRGLFYGAVTLWQLCSAQALRDGEIALPAMLITDSPRFRWRGLMLDSARHLQSPAFIMRYIDWMALHKLNVLGWHLTDDQGWRLEIRKYPRLTRVGAWRVPAGRAAQRDIDPATGQPRRYGGFYTQQQVREIVAHAAARNVTIVPEIDLPAHATAALIAYPTLAARPQDLPRAVPSDWGTYEHLCNIDESTFHFIEDVLDEVMALFPGEYLHIGGDEVLTDQWQASPRVQARMRALGIGAVGAVQGYFERRLNEYLQAHGRRLIGWDEILRGGLGPDATVMSWRGVGGAIAAAAAGHDAVLAPDPLLYLDHRQGEAPGEPPGRGPVISLRDVYQFDPLPGPLAGEPQHVLGLQASLWTEHVPTEEDAAYMTWPRAAAVAEVGWSRPERLDWNDFMGRLPAEFDRYRTLGIHYSDDVFTPARSVGVYERHMSQDLKTCTGKLVLNLQDDAPVGGKRAVFLIDIENPCWIFPAADLSRAAGLTAAVGQVPFNFQIGKDRDAIRLNAPRTPAGELEVRLDACEGAPIAVLPLAPAIDDDAVTVLPTASLPPLAGVHALCLRFTQPSLDPLWAIDWVQLSH